MNINTLTDLKQNSIILELNYQQSEFDSNDKELLKGNFTRSPVHAIQFLTVYAGLDETQRQAALKKLNNKNINKKELDSLILDINWPAVLNQSDIANTLAFEFSIGVVNKAFYLDAVKDTCPALHKALVQKDCIVKIEECDRVIFKTKISQNELWQRSFTRESGDNFWTVPEFKLSDSLQKIIQGIAESKSMNLGAFRIQKGTGKASKQIELHIRAPKTSNECSISNKIEVNRGIYEAFVGLNDFYGLPRVDDVIVELESQAKFSDEGASASQTQVSNFFYESCVVRIDEPTTIMVNNLHVLFKGADLVANFSKPSQGAFNEDHYIELPTQSKIGTGISLLSQMPTPNEAFLLNCDKEKSKTFKREQESLLTSFINNLFREPSKTQDETINENTEQFGPK